MSINRNMLTPNNAIPSAWAKRLVLNSSYTPESFGASGQGIVDDTQACLSWISYTQTYRGYPNNPQALPGNPGDTRGLGTMVPGSKYAVTGQLTVDTDLMSLEGNGAMLDATNAPGGTTLWINGFNASGFNTGQVRNLSVNANRFTGGNCIDIGNANVFGTPGLHLQNIICANGYYGINIAHQGVWLLDLDHIWFTFNQVGLNYAPIQSSGGETIQLNRPIFNGCVQSIVWSNVFGDLFIRGGSNDYPLAQWLSVLNGHIVIEDMHFETSHINLVVGYILSFGGNQLHVLFKNCSFLWVGGATGSQLINNFSTAAESYPSEVIFEDCQFDGFGNNFSQMCTEGGGVTKFIRSKGLGIYTPSVPPIQAAYLNVLADGGFETGGAVSSTDFLDNWLLYSDTAAITNKYNNGNNITISISNAQAHSGTYSLAAVKTGGAATNAAFALLIPITERIVMWGYIFWYRVASSGQCNSVNVTWNAVSISGNVTGTAGNAATVVPIYGQTQNLVSTTIVTPTTTWQQLAINGCNAGDIMNKSIPGFATHLALTIDLTAGTAGTLYTDDFKLNPY